MFAPIDGPIHKRAPIAEQGYFLGYQWPAMLVLRISDGKVINVSRQKVRVYESAYIGPLDQKMISDKIESEFEINENQKDKVMEIADQNDSQVYGGPTVQSIKALRHHKLKLPGLNNKEGSEIEESARFGNTESFREGLYFDDVLSTPVSQSGRLEENARNGLTLKEALIKAIKEMTNGVQRMSLKKGKKQKDDDSVSTSNIISKKRRRQIEKHVTFENGRKVTF